MRAQGALWVSAYAETLGLSVKRLNRLTKRQACVPRRPIREACERLLHLDAPSSVTALDRGLRILRDEPLRINPTR